MKELKSIIRNYFGFSAREVNGFMFMVLIAPICLFSVPIYRAFSTPPTAQFTTDQVALDSLLTLMEAPLPSDKDGNAKKAAVKLEAKRFPFDPNTASVATLIELGIPSYLAERIIKYRSKGGQFRKKADLQKIYSFPEGLYLELAPFITLPEIKTAGLAPSPTTGKRKPDAPKEKQDLATADTTALKSIYGVGSVLAKRIVKFRDKLGGFHSEEQLFEVYGLKPETVEKILLRFELKKASVKTLPINTIAAKDLVAHPYLNWDLTNALLKLRKSKERFSQPSDLGGATGWDTKLIEKMTPYLDFEN